MTMLRNWSRGLAGEAEVPKFLEAVEEDRESDDDDKVTRACKGKEKKLKKALNELMKMRLAALSRKVSRFSRMLSI